MLLLALSCLGGDGGVGVGGGCGDDGGGALYDVGDNVVVGVVGVLFVGVIVDAVGGDGVDEVCVLLFLVLLRLSLAVRFVRVL